MTWQRRLRGARCAVCAIACVAVAVIGCERDRQQLIELPGPERVGVVLLNELQTLLESAEGARSGEEKAARLGELGIELTAHQVYDVAADALGLASEQAPDNFKWVYLRGYVLFQLGAMKEAAEAFERACSLEPENVPCAAWRVQTLLQLGQGLDAREEFEARLSNADDVAYARFLAGEIAGALGEWTVAASEYRAALQLQPQAAALNRSLARVERLLGNAEESRRLLELANTDRVVLDDRLVAEVIERDRSPTKLMERGREALNAGDADRAKDFFREASERAPGDAAGPYNEGIVLMRERNIDAAVASFEEALLRNPRHLDALLALGALTYQRGDVSGGIELLERAREGGSADTELLFHLGNAYLRGDEPASALTQFERLLELRAEPDERVLYAAAVAASRTGDDQRALALIEQACVDACGLQAMVARIRLLALARDPASRDRPRALALAQDLRRQTNDAQVALALGEAMAANQDFAAASTLLAELQTAADRAGQSSLATRAAVALQRSQNGIVASDPGL